MKPTLILTLAGISLSSLASGQIYMVGEGKFAVTPSVSYTSFDEFYAGDTEMGVPGGGDIERLSYRVYFDYGLTDDLTLDASLGFADTESALDSDSALADTTFGIRWQFMNQAEQCLDAMVRLGVSIEGDYDTGFLSAPGDGASGVDISTKFGRELIADGLRADVAAGYAFKSSDVPDSYWVRFTPSVPLTPWLSLDASYTYFSGVDGIDIGGPGFTGLGDLPRVEEEGHVLEGGLAFSTDFGYYRLAYSQLLEGRNVGKEKSISIAASFKF